MTALSKLGSGYEEWEYHASLVKRVIPNGWLPPHRLNESREYS
jgi:hypothetical protein